LNTQSKDVNLIFSKTLRAGVTISATVIIIGLLKLLITGESGYPGDSYPYTITELFSGVIKFKSYAIILLGLLFLLLTPIMRVVMSVFIFWKEKDYTYVKITLLVLLILIAGMLLGKV
jgi:uncharacterized membrane protein